jgi:hypothetical protein
VVKLTIELVPKTCWFANLRSIVKSEDWDILRKETYKLAGYYCEICGGKGVQWPVECHEVWEYDDERKIQRLKKLIALCPSCHEVKHVGYANIRNRGEIAIKHLAKINEWSINEAEVYVKQCFETWVRRSKFNWHLDLSYLEKLNI